MFTHYNIEKCCQILNASSPASCFFTCFFKERVHSKIKMLGKMKPHNSIVQAARHITEEKALHCINTELYFFCLDDFLHFFVGSFKQ